MAAITMLGEQSGVSVTNEDKEALKEAIHVRSCSVGHCWALSVVESTFLVGT